jgi:hypothetical protein
MGNYAALNFWYLARRGEGKSDVVLVWKYLSPAEERIRVGP